MKEIFLATFLAAAAATDLKWQRVPNKLIILGCLGGLMIRTTSEGLYGAVGGILQGLFTIAAFYIFYMIGAVGAGDVKLLSVVGLTEGVAVAGQTALYSLPAAGLMAMIFVIVKRQAFIRFYQLFSHISTCVRQKKILRYSALEEEGYLHYALYISIGFMAVLWRKELE
ncbi:MAG: A24 family peptidase [Lachnospiraceae bacterium]|nr:A24 family peptidase [Lachnospiraceae bacterium]